MSDPFSAVPPEAREGLAQVVARALQPVALSDENSAEAVTWTLFSHLLQSHRAQACWQLLADESAWPAALLWGGEALGEQAEFARERLVEKSPEWAPDVVLEFWPGGLVIIVARYLAPNPDVKQGWGAWLDESGAFDDAPMARASGRFDLARAWRIGCELAGARRFTLINLLALPERAQQRAATDLFRSSLVKRNDREFKQLTWRALLAALPEPWPEWLTRFVASRRLR